MISIAKKKIAFISQPIYFHSMYGEALNNLYEVREFENKFCDDEYLELINFDADYNIFFRGEYIPDKVLNKLKGYKIALSSEPFPRYVEDKWHFTADSIVRYSEFRKIRNKNFDYVFHYDRHSLELFEKDNMKIAGEFILPVDLTMYNVQPNNEKVYDVFFIGRATKHRNKLFDFCKSRINFLHIAHGVQGEDLIDYFDKSTICLNAHAEDEISWEPRMQMMMACNAFVMSEKISQNSYLIPGKHFVEYEGAKDLYEKIQYYLEHADERKIIADAGREAVEKYFSSSMKFTNLIKGIKNNEYDKFVCGMDNAPSYYNNQESKDEHLQSLSKILNEHLEYSKKDQELINYEKMDNFCTYELSARNSKSFKLGNLFFRSIKKPHKLITYPYNFIKILFNK